MKKRRISDQYVVMVLSLFALLLSNVSYAGERYLLYMGGGGEPANEATTIFDDGLKSMGNYLKSNPWHSDVRFNGGHSTTESILNTQFQSSATTGPFTAASFKEMIKKYEDAIKSGAVGPGDQLMVVLDTHGAENNEFNHEKTHSIAVDSRSSGMNLNTLEGSTSVSMDEFQSLAALAKSKGVKLAIADLSCHSGNSLALANENTCVISSTGPNHYAFNTFSPEFIKNMKHGKSLEDVFLETRKAMDDPSYPMISTSVGKKLNQRLYAGITPFLFYANQGTHADKISGYLENIAKSCPSGGDRTVPLMAQIQQLETTLNDSHADTSELRDLLQQYQKRQDQITNALRSWGAGELNTVENCHASAKYGKNKHEDWDTHMTWQELLRSELTGNIEYLTGEMNKEKYPQERAQLQAGIECLKKNQAKKEEIIATHPELATYEEKAKTLRSQVDDTYQLASKIGAADRKLYQTFYEDLSKGDKDPNACKDFAL